MRYESAQDANKLRSSILLRGGLALLVLLTSLTLDANSQTQPKTPATSTVVSVTHVLGFEDVPRGLRGDLSIIDGYLHFQRDGIASVQVPIASIQNVYVG